MLTIKHYARPQTVPEALRLLREKKSNVALGGMLWLKLQDKTVDTAVDLAGLGLDAIEETPGGWRIGAMVSLRQLETHEGLAAFTGGAMAESVKHIVGVQLRNLATIGGSVFGRFGFSDPLTLLLALDARVELAEAGRMSLRDFAESDIRKWKRSISPSAIPPPISPPSPARWRAGRGKWPAPWGPAPPGHSALTTRRGCWRMA